MKELMKFIPVVALFCSFAEVFAQEHTGEIIVKFKAGAAPLSKGAGDIYSARHGLYVVRQASVNLQKIRMWNFEEELARLQDDPNVEYAEPNWIQRIPKPVTNEVQHIEFEVENAPNDPRFSQQYAHSKIETPFAWDKSTGTWNVLVAVIDTGVDYNHEDLKANIFTNPNEQQNGIDDDGNGYVDDLRGWDFVNADNNPMDDNSHGSHVSGIIGAVGNNGKGIVGVNWAVKILPCKFLDADGSGSTLDAAEAIYYAADMGADVLSNSWGGGPSSRTLSDAIAYSRDKGCLFVAAAGNESNNNDSSPSYPASYKIENVLSVAASDANDKLASFSNFGKNSVHLAAPGVSILSTTPGNTYQKFSGTSMSTPVVAGAAALLLSISPSITFAQLKTVLYDNADKILTDKVAYGRLNVGNAAQNLNPSEPPDEEPQPPPASGKCGNKAEAYLGILVFGYLIAMKKRWTIRITPNEGWLRYVVWCFRSLIRSMHRPPGMNHYCVGESGLGEWSCRSDVSSICHYCKESN